MANYFVPEPAEDAFAFKKVFNFKNLARETLCLAALSVLTIRIILIIFTLHTC